MRCFEKVIKIDPNNMDALDTLCKMYTESKDQEKRDIATKYFKQVLT